MRLIDADYITEGRVSNDPGVIAAKCAPTIPAITVEWLRGLMIEYANINTLEHAAYAYCLQNVIEEWHKEQEESE